MDANQSTALRDLPGPAIVAPRPTAMERGMIHLIEGITPKVVAPMPARVRAPCVKTAAPRTRIEAGNMSINVMPVAPHMPAARDVAVIETSADPHAEPVASMVGMGWERCCEKKRSSREHNCLSVHSRYPILPRWPSR